MHKRTLKQKIRELFHKCMHRHSHTIQGKHFSPSNANQPPKRGTGIGTPARKTTTPEKRRKGKIVKANRTSTEEEKNIKHAVCDIKHNLRLIFKNLDYTIRMIETMSTYNLNTKYANIINNALKHFKSINKPKKALRIFKQLKCVAVGVDEDLYNDDLEEQDDSEEDEIEPEYTHRIEGEFIYWPIIPRERKH